MSENDCIQRNLEMEQRDLLWQIVRDLESTASPEKDKPTDNPTSDIAGSIIDDLVDAAIDGVDGIDPNDQLKNPAVPTQSEEVNSETLNDTTKSQNEDIYSVLNDLSASNDSVSSFGSTKDTARETTSFPPIHGSNHHDVVDNDSSNLETIDDGPMEDQSGEVEHEYMEIQELLDSQMNGNLTSNNEPEQNDSMDDIVPPRVSLNDRIQREMDELREGLVSPLSYCSDSEFVPIPPLENDCHVGQALDDGGRPSSPLSDCSDEDFSMLRFQIVTELRLTNTKTPHRFYQTMALERSLSPVSGSEDELEESGFNTTASSPPLHPFLYIPVRKIDVFRRYDKRGERKQQCWLCCRKFKKEAELASHIEDHENGVLMTCCLCRMDFKPAVYFRHMVQLHGVKISRKPCRKTPSDEQNRKKANEDKPDIVAGEKCPVCDGMFKRVKTHFNLAHKELNWDDYAEKNEDDEEKEEDENGVEEGSSAEEEVEEEEGESVEQSDEESESETSDGENEKKIIRTIKKKKPGKNKKKRSSKRKLRPRNVSEASSVEDYPSPKRSARPKTASDPSRLRAKALAELAKKRALKSLPIKKKKDTEESKKSRKENSRVRISSCSSEEEMSIERNRKTRTKLPSFGNKENGKNGKKEAEINQRGKKINGKIGKDQVGRKPGPQSKTRATKSSSEDEEEDIGKRQIRKKPGTKSKTRASKSSSEDEEDSRPSRPLGKRQAPRKPGPKSKTRASPDEEEESEDEEEQDEEEEEEEEELPLPSTPGRISRNRLAPRFRKDLARRSPRASDNSEDDFDHSPDKPINSPRVRTAASRKASLQRRENSTDEPSDDDTTSKPSPAEPSKKRKPSESPARDGQPVKKKRLVGPKSVMMRLNERQNQNGHNSDKSSESASESERPSPPSRPVVEKPVLTECRICNLRFRDLDMHFAKKHPNESVVRSPSPEKEDSSSEEDYSPSSEEEELFRCKSCPMIFKDEVSLKYHNAIHSGRTSCPVCRRGHVPDLRYHLTEETCAKMLNVYREKEKKKVNGESTSKLECETCHRTFRSQHQLVEHREIHQTCDICEEDFHSPMELYLHKVTDHDYRSEIPEKKSSGKLRGPKCARKRHVSAASSRSTISSASSRSTLSALTCRICKKVMTSKTRLVSHLQDHAAGL